MQLDSDLLVLLAIVSKDEILQLHLHLDPLLICQGWPDVVRLCYGCLVWFQNNFGSIVIHMKRSENQNQTRECLRGEKEMQLEHGKQIHKALVQHCGHVDTAWEVPGDSI